LESQGASRGCSPITSLVDVNGGFDSRCVCVCVTTHTLMSFLLIGGCGLKEVMYQMQRVRRISGCFVSGTLMIRNSYIITSRECVCVCVCVVCVYTRALTPADPVGQVWVKLRPSAGAAWRREEDETGASWGNVATPTFAAPPRSPWATSPEREKPLLRFVC